MKEQRIGVMVSTRGRGSNFQAILKASQSGALSASVGLLVTTHEEHGAVKFAREAEIPVMILSPSQSPAAWEKGVANALHEHKISHVALAGYMRRVGDAILREYQERIVNVHPSLLPAFGGMGMYGEHVHEAVLEKGCKVSGCTVHFVDERYDTGPIIAQQCVPVEDNDTTETLAARVRKVENELYPQCLEWLVRGHLRLQGRRVFYLG